MDHGSLEFELSADTIFTAEHMKNEGIHRGKEGERRGAVIVITLTELMLIYK